MVTAGERLSKDAIKEAAFLRQRPWLRCSGRGNPILHTIIVYYQRDCLADTRPTSRLFTTLRGFGALDCGMIDLSYDVDSVTRFGNCWSTNNSYTTYLHQPKALLQQAGA